MFNNVFIILIFLIFSSSSLARRSKVQDFWVSFQGLRKELSLKQKKAELKLLKGYKQCQGELIVEKKTTWTCLAIGPELFKCKAKYGCNYVTRVKNHKSQEKLIRKTIAKIRYKVGKFNVVVSDKEPEFRKGQRSRKKEKLVVVKRRVLNANKDRTFKPQVLSSGIKVRKKKVQTKKTKRRKLITTKNEVLVVEEDELSDLDALKENFDFSKSRKRKKKGDWRIQDEGITDEGEPTFFVKPTIYTDDYLYKSEIVLASFGTSWLIAKDSSGNGLSTIDLAWTPYFWLASWVGFRGHLGGHFFSTTKISEGIPKEETFLITELSLYADLRYKNVYVEIGSGVQNWNDEAGGSFGLFSMGLGYTFVHKKLKYIDRVFFSYNTVATEQDYQELKLGLGMSF